MRILMWFRSDLRTCDNTALHHACSLADQGVIGVFLLSGAQWQSHDWGAVKVDFALRNLAALSAELVKRRIPLLIRRVERFSAAPGALLSLAREHRCDGVYFNKEYELNEHRRDQKTIAAFEAAGLAARGFDDQTILPPDLLRTGEGRWYTVFTPYKNAWLAEVKKRLPIEPLGEPRKQIDTGIAGDDPPAKVAGYCPSPIPAGLWPAGQKEAARRLEKFIAGRLFGYKDRRDLPGVEGTSALSPYLAVGAISPRQCLAAAAEANGGALDRGRIGAVAWINELIWREFYRGVMVGFPRVCMHQPFKLDTLRIRWNDDRSLFDRWREGKTGVPIVDAAQRQLLATGWMHNRLRMITAMFLTKDLLIDWRWGERHFMHHLIDGDLASNNGGWQWSASTGTDAAPYFRIFNPWTQSRNFDGQGGFIRRHCPELASLDDDGIHAPHELPPLIRDTVEYPDPIVDHAAARRRVMEAFGAVKMKGEDQGR